MAEPFGIAAGALSIAGLFNNCVECFEYIQIARSFGQDFQTCQLKLDIAKVRLTRWGQSVNIHEDDTFTTFKQGSGPAVSARQILEHLLVLFSETQKVSDRYNTSYTERPSALAPKDISFGLDAPFLGLHNRMQELCRQRQRRLGLGKKTYWALYDRNKFQTLIQQATEFIETLEKLFPAEAKRRSLASQEVEGVGDLSMLKALKETAAGVDEELSEAAKEKAQNFTSVNLIKNVDLMGSVKVRVGDEYNDPIAASVPHQARAAGTNNVVQTLEARDQSAIHVGNRYGGKSVFD